MQDCIQVTEGMIASEFHLSYVVSYTRDVYILKAFRDKRMFKGDILQGLGSAFFFTGTIYTHTKVTNSYDRLGICCWKSASRIHIGSYNLLHCSVGLQARLRMKEFTFHYT